MSDYEQTYLTVRETAEIMNVSVATVRRIVEAGNLQAYRFTERNVRIELNDLAAYMAKCQMVKPIQETGLS